MEQIYALILEKDDVTWQSLLYGLVKNEQMDPWDIDIGLLSQRYIEAIKKMQQTDFRISGKVLLAAAVLLKIKSTHLLEHDIGELDRLFARVEEARFDDDIPEGWWNPAALQKKVEQHEFKLIPKHPQPRKRKVSIYELIDALKKAMEVQQRKLFRNQPIKIEIPTKKFDIVEVVKDLYQKIKLHCEKNGNMTFTQLVPQNGRKEDKVYTFIPLLHLDTERKINLEQKEHFGEIWIQMVKG